MIAMTERKSLRQMAAEASQSEGRDPWECPRCGCKDWRVVNSHMRGDVRRRQRTCRHCEYDMTTIEFPVDESEMSHEKK